MPTKHNQIMSTVLWGFSQLTALYNISFLSSTVRDQLRLARTASLVGFHRLSKWAMQETQYTFHMIPKFHTLDHMVRRSYRTGIGVCLTWTFSDEDFMVFFIARVAASSHAASTNKVPAQRWLLSFSNGHACATEQH